MAIATAHQHSVLRDIGLLVARLVLGTLFVAHGAQKIFEWTLDGTTQSFADMGIPQANIAGPAVAILEFGGGIALILGLFTPIVGFLLAIAMTVAAVLVHAPNGIFVADQGWELVGALGAGALALAAAGAGRFSLDYLTAGRFLEKRRERKVEAEAAKNSTGRRAAETPHNRDRDKADSSSAKAKAHATKPASDDSAAAPAATQDAGRTTDINTADTPKGSTGSSAI